VRALSPDQLQGVPGQLTFPLALAHGVVAWVSVYRPPPGQSVAAQGLLYVPLGLIASSLSSLRIPLVTPIPAACLSDQALRLEKSLHTRGQHVNTFEKSGRALKW